MARRLNAELWDKMHYLFRDYNDRMVHVELRYDFRIDIEALKTVLICMFEKAPVLHSSFTDNRIHPYWTVEDYTINDILTVEEVGEAELDERIDAFLTQYIQPEAYIQMKVAVFNHGEKSVLCIVENHMCMDGGDLKYFVKTLCENYTRFADEGISPTKLRTGTRSYESVYEDFSATEKRMAKKLFKNINSKDNHGFPFTPDSIQDKSFIARRKIPADRFDAIRAAGKKHGATLNDMVLASYFYSLYDLAYFSPDESVSISCAIDLRRHLKDTEDQGVTNHTAWMQCKIPERGKDIFQTLEYVTESSQMFKRDRFMGLHGLPLLSFGYKAMPLAVSEEVIKIGYANPLLAMSNIGLLDANALSLSGNQPTDGFMSGAVKYKPYALLSLTTLNKEMTLSMCCRGNEKDRKIIDKFFDMIVENLYSMID